MKCEDLYIWKLSQSLFLDLYAIYKDSKEFYFKDQILRATLSISNNIAEGLEKRTSKDKMNFMYIAKGSTGEVRNMLYLAKSIGHISEVEFTKFHGITIQVGVGLSNLIKTFV